MGRAARTVDLATFAAAQPNAYAKCPVCELPTAVREQVEDDAHTGAIAARWLSAQHDVTIRPQAILKHRRDHAGAGG